MLQMKDSMNSKSKYFVIAVGLMFLNVAQAKTTSLLCETLAGAQSPIEAGQGFTVPHSKSLPSFNWRLSACKCFAK